MPSTTSHNLGDVVPTSFPFTDQVGSKKRPAVVVSSDACNRERPDVILMAVSSHVRRAPRFGEVLIQEWRGAGLIKPSVGKPVVFTADRGIVAWSRGGKSELLIGIS